MKDFAPVTWDIHCIDDCRQLVRLAMREELNRGYDWTTVSLVPSESRGSADVVARKQGVLSGLMAAAVLFEEMGVDLTLDPRAEDGNRLTAGQNIACISGSARDLLTAERSLLNFIGHMSGIATLTRQYVDAIDGTKARLYDTRKTTPGWRRLEKYSVRCGGGHNHRTGLFDAVLIKDNHLAHWHEAHTNHGLSGAIRQARAFLNGVAQENPALAHLIIEVEVDTLEQLREVLTAEPDIVLLDNMNLTTLRNAIQIRNELAPGVELEASGGVTLDTVRSIAETGVDRISCGALTHSAGSLDVALDWKSETTALV